MCNSLLIEKDLEVLKTNNGIYCFLKHENTLSIVETSFIGIKKRPDGSIGKVVYFNRINVSKEKRGLGIGNELLKSLLSECNNSNIAIMLEINPYGDLTYEQLKDWYIKNGFIDFQGIFWYIPKLDVEVSVNKMSKQNELVQYFIVNTDLGMSAGKIAAQVGHASMLIALRDQYQENFQVWKEIAMKKIVLSASEERMREIIESNPTVIKIIDKGYTEIAPGSLTVLGLPVMTRRQAYKWVHGLQTL